MLVSAFFERWHLETNTFHMTYGEMTITLDDVDILISIPVVGQSVSPLLWIIQRLLLSVTLKWLRANFSCVTDADTVARIQSADRNYLLYSIGCTFFSDKMEQEFLTFKLLKDLVMFLDLYETQLH